MSAPVMWIIPEAPAPAGQDASTRRALREGPIRIGILDNSKSNADHLLAMIIDGVTAKYPGATVVRTRKPSAANRAGPEVLDRLEQEVDVVISAMAD